MEHGIDMACVAERPPGQQKSGFPKTRSKPPGAGAPMHIKHISSTRKMNESRSQNASKARRGWPSRYNSVLPPHGHLGSTPSRQALGAMVLSTCLALGCISVHNLRRQGQQHSLQCL